MNETLTQMVQQHWKALLVLWIANNMVNALPSPNGNGPTNTATYKWFFTLLHSTFGMLPRIVATFFPQSHKIVAVVTDISQNGKEVQ